MVGTAAILPFIYLASFNHPLGTHEWDWISNWYGASVPVDFWQEQWYWYSTTMGRFFSTAMLSLTDRWYSLELFQGFFIVNLLILSVLSFFLTIKLWPALAKKNAIALALVLVALLLHQSVGIYDSFYRFTSVMTYHVGLWCTMAFAILLIGGLSDNRSDLITQLSLAFFALAAIGSNEISLVTVNFILGFVLLTTRLDKGSIPTWLWVLFLIIVIGNIVALGAPGNYVRMNYYDLSQSFLDSFFFTIATTVWLWLNWLGDSLLPLFILLWLPIGWKHRQVSGRLFKYPLPWLLVNLLIVPLSLFPLIHGTAGSSLPERVVDLLFFTVLWCVLGLCQSLLNRYTNSIQEFSLYRTPVWLFIAVFFIGQLFCSGLQINRNEDRKNGLWGLISVHSNIGLAYKCILEGSAARYDEAMKVQYRTLRSCQGTICQVEAPSKAPSLLYEALSDRRNQKGDPFMGSYFNNNIQLVRYK